MNKVTPEDLKRYEFYFAGTGSNTAPFEVFAKDFKKFIEQNIPKGARLIEFSLNHYTISGFIEKDYRFVYFSISDVRGFKSWYDNILIRIAKNERDYKGGGNRYTDLENFGEKVKELLEVQNEAS